MLEIVSGEFRFSARLEDEAAPDTVAILRGMLPLESRVIHVRWSGESMWIPFGDLELGLEPENATRFPNPGELLLFLEQLVLTARKLTNFVQRARVGIVFLLGARRRLIICLLRALQLLVEER